jgi:hypothetical protein
MHKGSQYYSITDSESLCMNPTTGPGTYLVEIFRETVPIHFKYERPSTKLWYSQIFQMNIRQEHTGTYEAHRRWSSENVPIVIR